MKILNLYAGIGGNRKLWGDEHKITAIEYKPEIAEVYKKLYPNDTVVIGDAHQYLLEHYKEFDFIWSSPPCPTHSVTNNFLNAQGVVRYPDMSLWQEIVFLQKWFKGKYVVENVISYYPPLYPPIALDRHYFWANFLIPDITLERNFNIINARKSTRQTPEVELANLQQHLGIYLPEEVKKKRLLLRNCVPPIIGKHILDHAINSPNTLF